MSAFLAQVAHDIVNRFGHELHDIAIVFNNQRPITYLKKHLADQIGRAFWSPAFFTIQDLLRTAHSRQEINTTAQLFVLYEAYCDVMGRKGQTPQPIDSFYPVAEVILGDFAQIDYEMVNAGDVFQQLHDMSLLNQQFDYLTDEQKEFLQRFWSTFSADQYTAMQARFLELWGLLPELYARFKTLLRVRNQHTMAGIYRDLAERSAETTDLAESYRQILFVGFNALNRCEQTIFQRLQEQGKALFYFDADTHYVNDPLHEAGLFIRKNTEQHQLANALGEFPDSLRQATTPISLLAAPGHAVQAKSVSLLLEQPADPEQSTAVILADESLLMPMLQSLPADEKVNITMGFPITQSTLYSLLDLYLEYHAAEESAKPETSAHATVPYGLLYAYVTHPLSGAPASARQQLAKALQDTGNPEAVPDSAMLAATVYPAFFERIPHRDALFDRLIALLTAVFRREQGENKLRVIEQHLIQNAIQQLNQLQLGMAQAVGDPSITLTARLARRVLRTVSAAIVGDPLDGLQVMGLLESRNLNFDRIYLVGANEGVLPAVSSSPSFIPYHVRKAYGMPVRENQDALSAYLFYRLLHHCEECTILFNALVDNSNSGEPSRFVKQIQYETQLPITEIEVTWPREQNSSPPTPPELNIPKDGTVWKLLEQYLVGSDGKADRTLSASAFTLFLNSPLEFFFRYVARIKEPPTISEGIEANKLGQVIHDVMEYFYRDWHDRGIMISAEDIAQRKPLLPQLCQAALHRVYHLPTPATKPYTSHQRILLELAQTYCGIFIDYDQTVAPFEILEMENETDYFYDFPIIANGERRLVRLRGIIDRVDRNPAGLVRIVDYKTGRDDPEFRAVMNDEKEPEFEFFRKNWQDSNKALLQTLFYTLIYEQVAQTHAVQPNLYAIQHLRNTGSLFRFKVPYQGVYELKDGYLARAKEQFARFLQERLEALFDPKRPFAHNPDATVYDSSPYYPFLTSALNFALDDDRQSAEG